MSEKEKPSCRYKVITRQDLFIALMLGIMFFTDYLEEHRIRAVIDMVLIAAYAFEDIIYKVLQGCIKKYKRR